MNNDISKCDGILDKELCPNKERCLRFTIKADDLLQSWIRGKVNEKGKCQHFLDNYADEKRHKDHR